MVDMQVGPTPQAKVLRRVREISTSRLFGLYDHHVPLFLEDRVTIIHGPNGVGKTILLKLVNALFLIDFPFLLSVPFHELKVTLDDGAVIRVWQNSQRGVPETDSTEENSTNLIVEASLTGSSSPLSFEVNSNHLNFDEWASQFESAKNWIQSVGSNRWIDLRTDQAYNSYELWRVFGAESGIKPRWDSVVPEAFRLLVGEVKTYLVEAQRLFRFSPPKRRTVRYEVPAITPTVLYDAQDLAGRMRESFAQYGRISQSLDQSFPQRLFQTVSPMSSNDIVAAVQELDRERVRLQDLGILDRSPPPYPFDISSLNQRDLDARLDAMSLYTRDTQKKLKVLSELAERVEPLVSSINSKFKNKYIVLDRERGLIARNSSDDCNIGLEQLSSGEQHEIVLLYNLLFRVQPNTLVLLDEPELSLHIEWQRQFLPELLKIAEATKIDAVVATHSISIVGDRHDLMVPLTTSVRQRQ